MAVALTGCGSGTHRSTADAGIPQALLRAARPIGSGPAFHPGVTGPVLGPCRRVLGPRRGVHLEVFAANRVVLIPAGLGTRPPRRYSAGRISAARCFADLITIEPTGVILLRPGSRRTLGDVFRSWGQPLSTRRVASFAAGRGSHVVLYVDGQRRPGSPGALRLRPHMEIVLEVGPHVPPHRTYRFPPGT